MTKYIHLNLKRFDVLDELGGVNHSKDITRWASNIMEQVQPTLIELKRKYDIECVVYFPETHLLPALSVQMEETPLKVGCQSVYRRDVSAGGNFGAFTTNRPAASMKQLGVTHTLIGHFEERLDKKELLEIAGATDFSSVNTILNQEIKAAQNQGLKVLYCIGESAEERMGDWQSVLKEQVLSGLVDVEEKSVVIAYEPIWAIGPGKTPPSFEQIQEVSDFLKSLKPDIPVIYGGGLKLDNAKGMATIDSLDGGLIALTRFSGDIGFYPEEYLAIINEYLGEK
mgnify:CR=1 FL=1